MAFWKENRSDPSRKFRFQVDGSGIWWWIRAVNKPSFEINSNEYLLINHKFKYPGVLTWNDITITMVDPGGIVKKVNDYLTKHGYSEPKKNKTGIQKNGYDGAGGKLIIQQLGSDGKSIEQWELYGSFIKSVQYGDLAYADDDLVEIQMVISYDYAILGSDDVAPIQ